MSAEQLRKAAALMRERAEASVPGPWPVEDDNHLALPMAKLPFAPEPPGRTWRTVNGPTHYEMAGPTDGTTIHMASWHPAVAVAVAALLEGVATMVDLDGVMTDGVLHTRALALARAYLGGPA